MKHNGKKYPDAVKKMKLAVAEQDLRQATAGLDKMIPVLKEVLAKLKQTNEGDG